MPGCARPAIRTDILGPRAERARIEAEGLPRTEWCRQVLDAAAKKTTQTFLLG